MMKILIAINDKYIEQALVLFQSLIDNQGSDIEIILLTAGLSERNKMIIQRTLNKYGCMLRHVPVDQDLFKDAPKRMYISVETYFRLLAFELLPDVDKVLYLDADIVVDDSLEELWNLDMKEYCIAGVEDQGNVREDMYHKAMLGLKKKSIYINGGVLLMNLENIRKKTSVNEILAYITEMGDKLKYQDQDIINVIFENDICYLPEKYNCTPLYKDPKDFIRYYCYPHKRNRPCIIHYMGGTKPWMDFYGYKYFKEYKKYSWNANCRILKQKLMLNSVLRPVSLMIQYYKDQLYR